MDKTQYVENSVLNSSDEEENIKEKEDIDSEVEINKYDSDDAKSESSESQDSKEESISQKSEIEEPIQKEESEPEKDPQIYLEQIYQIFTEDEYPKLNKDLLNNVVNYLKTLKNIRGLLINFDINTDEDIDKDKLQFETKLLSYLFEFVLKSIKVQKVNEEVRMNFVYISELTANYIMKSMPKINEKGYEILKEGILSIINSVIELYYIFVSAHDIELPKTFFNSSLNYLSSVLNIQDNQVINHIDEANIKQYLEVIYILLLNRFEYHIMLDMDEMKNIFMISFCVLKNKIFSNVFFISINIITIILEQTKEESFAFKFFDNILDIYKQFIVNEKIKERFYNLDKNLIIHYHHFYGEYKCQETSQNIALYTYLFLKGISALFLSEDLKNYITYFFNQIFIHIKDKIILIFYCIFDDLLKIKYSLEFSVNYWLIGTFCNYFLDIVSCLEFDIVAKKYFIALLNLIYTNLLKDMEDLKKFHLCFNEENKQLNHKKIKKNNKNEECICFSCFFTEANKNESFYCSKCKCKSNFQISIMNENYDENCSICGFCNFEKYFESNNLIIPNEKNIKLIELNEDNIINSKTQSSTQNEYIPKNTQSNNNSQIHLSDNYLCTSFVPYQDKLLKRSFTLIKIIMLKYLELDGKKNDIFISNELLISFKNYLKFIIGEKQIKHTQYKQIFFLFCEFYEKMKRRLENIYVDFRIKDDLQKYFGFYHFYVNLLFTGHLKILDILIDKKTHFHVKAGCIKIIDKFITFEGKKHLFKLLNIDLMTHLLSSNYSNVKDGALTLIFKLFKNEKISKQSYIILLLNHSFDESVNIRKRIIEAYSDMIILYKEREFLKNVMTLFEQKYDEKTESDSIKTIISNFFIKCLTLKKDNENDLLRLTLDHFIMSLNNAENNNSNNENYYFLILEKLFNEIHSNLVCFDSIINYIFHKYIIDNQVSKKSELIAPYLLLQILSKYNFKSIQIYAEFIIQNFNTKYEDLRDTRLAEITCYIFYNIFSFSNDSINDNIDNKLTIKYATIEKIEKALMKTITDLPNSAMKIAIKTYFKIVSTGFIQINEIFELIFKTFCFLEDMYLDDKINAVIPDIYITKSLLLLGISISCLKKEDMLTIFSQNKNLKYKYGKKLQLSNISDYIFKILSFYSTIKCESNSTINFDALKSLSYFWISFPQYLESSKDILNYIFTIMYYDEQKLEVISAFSNFFSQIKEKISLIVHNKVNDNQDYGVLHLFFDSFMKKFSEFLINESNPFIKYDTLCLFELTINSGNLNIYTVLPNVFASLFDWSVNIRFIATNLIQKTIDISQSKFFNSMKDCLIASYIFNKKMYGISSYFNTFVKSKKNNGLYNTLNESVFELLLYKVSKKDPNHQIPNKLLDSMCLVLNGINNIDAEYEEAFDYKSARDLIEKIEYYGFIAKLIADYKYSTTLEILVVLDRIYPEFEVLYPIFKSKLKSFKEASNFDDYFNMKYLCVYFATGIMAFLFKFIFIKYNLFSEEDLEKIKIQDWTSFSNTFKEKKGIDNKYKKKNRKNEFKIFNNTLRFKFCDFFDVFYYMSKNFIKLITKKGKVFNNKDKEIILNTGYELKQFIKMDNLNFVDFYRQCIINKKKEKRFSIFYDLFSEYVQNILKEKKDNKTNKTELKQTKKRPVLKEINNNSNNCDIEDINDENNIKASPYSKNHISKKISLLNKTVKNNNKRIELENDYYEKKLYKKSCKKLKK